MSSIRVLPEEVANRIAAGEVVERPASVVKELVENSLDAEATRIDVAIAGGGIRWISVTDDGIGLTAEDAKLAFQRHATSKIRTGEDLASVETLGFRGEALPSIASVARVRMRTRRPADPVGVEVIGEGDGIEEVRPVGCPEGTRVEVAELFSRVPARRKFLKSEITEGSHVLRWLERLALVRPDVRIALERDGRSVALYAPTRDPRERVIAVLPPSFGERLLPVQGESPQAHLTGFASPTDVTRGSGTEIYLFVNARPVRDRLLLQAVREAYRDALPPGRHPVVVLFLQVDPGELDVNVHPAKWEVRFRDPAGIHRLVRTALREAVGVERVLDRGAHRHEGRPEPRTRDTGLFPPPDRWLGDPPASVTGPEASPGSTTADRSAHTPGSARAPVAFSSLRYVGLALGTYLLFERPGGLVVLDQHAAHERVLYEQLREAWFGGKVERQALLIPVWTELPRSAAEPLRLHADQLSRAGFEIEVAEGGVRGGLRVGLRTVPAVLADRPPPEGWARLLEETAVALREPQSAEEREGLEAGVHAALATAACHTACRKGDRLEPREVQALLEALDRNVWFPNCPHGRPLLALLDQEELERRFLRR
jgi:DNA mismatch repair protein MutL